MVQVSEADLKFREMVQADLDDVLIVEERAYAFPWTRGIFTDCLSKNYVCRVACVEGEIVGHAVLSFGAGEAHLLNICISRLYQGYGFGRVFARHMADKAAALGAQTLYLEVRPTNRSAIALYQSMGFAQIGTRKDYYPVEGGREDAWVLALAL